ncbi:MAG: mercury(II) reductase [Nitrospirae bacterium]|nr:mercury(II) reductase [Nitrospirota bacterium]
MEKYDLIIIGGGAAGFSAAIKADSLGAKTLIVNAGLPMGGTCVNVGCVPTKFLLEVAKDYFRARNYPFKSLKLEAEIGFAEVVEEKDELVTALRKANYSDVLENLPQVTYKEGKGRFLSAGVIEVKGERFSGDKFIISPGSAPKVLPLEGLKEAGFLTNRTALELKSLPESMLVIGAGPIGLEFAQIFSRLGSKVTVLELLERILPQAEPVVSEELQKCLQEEGINIITGAKIKKIEKKDGKKIVVIERENSFREIPVEEILLAAGVVGNSRELGLENLGIEVDKGGFIKVDEYLQTSQPQVYAAGDVSGTPWLETVAAKEGNIACKNALGEERIQMDYHNIPAAVFTSPQVASVGMKEAEYMTEYGTCLCRMVKMDRVPKALALQETKGLIFMVIGHEDKKIKGVHIVSELASEIIHEATLAVKQEMTIDEIIDTVHVFPTFSEAIKIAAQAFTHDPKKMSCCVE